MLKKIIKNSFKKFINYQKMQFNNFVLPTIIPAYSLREFTGIFVPRK